MLCCHSPDRSSRIHLLDADLACSSSVSACFCASPLLTCFFPPVFQASRSVNWWRMVSSFANLLRSTPGHGAARTRWLAVREDTWESVSWHRHSLWMYERRTSCSFFCSDEGTDLFWSISLLVVVVYLTSSHLDNVWTIVLTRLPTLSQVRERVQPTPVCLRSCPGCAAWGSCVVCCVATGSPRRLTGTCKFRRSWLLVSAVQAFSLLFKNGHYFPSLNCWWCIIA